MSPGSHHPSERPHDERLARLLDGSLDAQAAVELEAQLARDPVLRAELDEFRAVDTRLRALFAPSMRPMEGTTDAAPPPARSKGRSVWAQARAIAAVLVLGALAWWAFSPQLPAWADQAASLYRQLERNAFAPDEVCTTPEQFSAWTSKNLGYTLWPAGAGDGDGGAVRWVGWSYSPTITTYTSVLITKVDGRGVIVLLDRWDERTPRSFKAGDGLNVFRRRFGPITAFEVTPLDRPRVLPELREDPPPGLAKP